MRIVFDQPDTATLGRRPFQDLQRAFGQFHRHFCVEHREKLHALAAGQRPGAMVLSCCDSRTDPALLFACEPGDIFVNRSIGALAPPHGDGAGACMRASTAYAVDSLGVSDIIVLGHTCCGGMKGLAAGIRDTPLDDWLRSAQPLLDEARRRRPDACADELQTECERLGPVFSARNLMTYPWIAAAVAERRLTVHAWLFDLRTGGLDTWDFERGSWTALSTETDAD